MCEPTPTTSRLPLGLRLVAWYFVVTAALEVPFLFVPQRNPERRRGGIDPLVRVVTLEVLYVVCGVGLLRRRPGARTLGLFLLPVNAFYGAYNFAWGFAHGRPSPSVLAVSFVIVGVWSAFWFHLLYRPESARALQGDP